MVSGNNFIIFDEKFIIIPSEGELNIYNLSGEVIDHLENARGIIDIQLLNGTEIIYCYINYKQKRHYLVHVLKDKSKKIFLLPRVDDYYFRMKAISKNEILFVQLDWNTKNLLISKLNLEDNKIITVKLSISKESIKDIDIVGCLPNGNIVILNKFMKDYSKVFIIDAETLTVVFAKEFLTINGICEIFMDGKLLMLINKNIKIFK